MNLRRYADRQRRGLTSQHPSRITRSAAWEGPEGSTPGDCL
ncbi:MAG TPA: hypothetical protein VFF52_10665 [Isosphaeraceae bacterium]|nr:hypothetical protein [Isosphaeraceae bacterium]